VANLKVVAVALVVLLLIVGVLAVVPLPGYYDVKVSVGSWELSAIIVDDFGISSVNGQTTGQSSVVDLAALGLAPPAITAVFKMTVCVGSACTSKSANQWFPSLPVINGGQLFVTNDFALGYVPAGDQPITVTLTQSGSTVATGSGTMCVGPGSGC
jgi:hypothetical protein